METVSEQYSYEWKTKTSWGNIVDRKEVTESEAFLTESSICQWKMSLEPCKADQECKKALFKLQCLPSTFDRYNEVWAKYSVKFYSGISELRLDDQVNKFHLKRVQKTPVKINRDTSHFLLRIHIAIEAKLTKFNSIKPAQEADHAILLAKDYASCFENSKYSDVLLCVGDTEFKAHRLILTTRSPVLAAILENNSLENKSGRIVISDFDEEVVRMFLRYVYSGFIDVPNYEMASNLLRMADKYAVEGLKALCGNYLVRTMTVTTCMDVMLLAEIHELPDLKKRAMKFFFCYSQFFTDSILFKAIEECSPNLLSEMLMQMAARNSSDSDLSRKHLNFINDTDDENNKSGGDSE